MEPEGRLTGESKGHQEHLPDAADAGDEELYGLLYGWGDEGAFQVASPAVTPLRLVAPQTLARALDLQNQPLKRFRSHQNHGDVDEGADSTRKRLNLAP